jgi:preprotein translocase subunit SecD
MIDFRRWRVLVVAAMCFPGLACATVQPPSAQSGAGMLIEVDFNQANPDTIFDRRVKAIGDSVRVALGRAKIGYVDLTHTGRSVSFAVRNVADLERAREAVRPIDAGAELYAAGNTLTLTLTDQAMRDQKRAAVEQSIEILRRRVDPDGVRQAVVQRQGENRILVHVPGDQDAQRLKALISRPATIAFRLLDEGVTAEEARSGRLPPTDELLPGDKKDRDATGELNHYVVRKQVMVSGDSLVEVKATTDQNSGGPAVSFRFDPAGARQFGQATRANVGKRFAIVLDNEVISAPVIREPILGGSGVISGRFTTQEVNDLALLLRAGALPAQLKVLEER